jgi:hypothetical protein
MHFIRLTLSNFGPFRDITVHFPSSGVFTISGPNASGKSQIIGGVIAAIVGKLAVRVDPKGAGPSCVELVLGDGSTEEIARLVVTGVTTNGDSRSTRAEITHTTTPLASTLLTNLKRGESPRLQFGRETRGSRLKTPDLDVFERIAPAELTRNPFWQQLRNSGWLESGIYSGGVQQVINLVSEFLSRVDADCIPLLIDDLFYQLDPVASDFCWQLLQLIGHDSQVIVVSSSRLGHPSAKHLVQLPPRMSPRRAMAQYVRFDFPPEIPDRSEKRKFKLGDRFSVPESKVCELKEVKGQNPVGSIVQVVDQYVVAFLNAGTPQVGSIYWGIQDDERTVVGVALTDKQCDEIRRIVVEKIGNITPAIAPSCLRIDFHPLASGTGTVPLYVVEVRVAAVQGKHLYATGSEEVYLKTEAGKKKLTVMQIQQELLKRMGNS